MSYKRMKIGHYRRFLHLTALLTVLILQTYRAESQDKLWKLNECIDLALKKNVQLNQVQLSGELNRINLEQAKMNRYPDLSFSDSHTLSYGNSTDASTNKTIRQNISSNNASLNSSVVLFNGFLLVNTVKQNQLLFQAGGYDVEKAKNDIILNVLAGYLQVLYSYEAVKITTAQIQSTKQEEDRTEKFVNAGKLPESNLFQIQSQLAADKVSAINAENQLQIAKVTLMQLMEMPVSDHFEVDTTGIIEPSVFTELSSDDIFKISEGIMPEIKSAGMKSNADSIGIQIARSLLLPKLTLGGSLKTGYSSSNSRYSTVMQQESIGYLQSNPAEQVLGLVPVTSKTGYPFSNQLQDNFNQAISLSLTIPIFSNYQGKYGIQKARINYNNAKLNEYATKNQLRKSIEQAYTDFVASYKNYDAIKDAFTSEQRSYRDMEKKFGLGLISATDFLIEKNNFERSDLSLVQAKYTYIFKSKIIGFYLGKPLSN